MTATLASRPFMAKAISSASSSVVASCMCRPEMSAGSTRSETKMSGWRTSVLARIWLVHCSGAVSV